MVQMNISSSLIVSYSYAIKFEQGYLYILKINRLNMQSSLNKGIVHFENQTAKQVTLCIFLVLNFDLGAAKCSLENKASLVQYCDLLHFQSSRVI